MNIISIIVLIIIVLILAAALDLKFKGLGYKLMPQALKKIADKIFHA